ncbi:mechanosensitive ion channel protein MscS [Rhodopirellula maiorica SM1]|uniref:Mechanosensitive ion channel protein MscS n=1 Tax=Rhodopirellula maiorica SM1 TaxID=1265738 RepID=M5REB4_9BACT|nr:mechanosensitive ion channel family protein [Rhodopirellula maiorica]EMI17426.1 mechanosensitive ion channel protein MscS [Rhodopirellula maiorica SM1]
MATLFSLPLAVFAVAQDGTAATEETSDPADDVANPKDVPGEVDVNIDTVWGTVDNMIDSFLDRLPFLLVGIVVFAIFYFVAKLVRRFIRSSTHGKSSANLGRVMGRVAQWVLVFVGLILAVAIMAPSVTPGKLLTSLGIGGVAIGFAFKDILQNFMAGLLILLNEPFKIGDQIVSGDHEGTVESIKTRATLIKTYDGKRVVIPNSQIYTNPVVVNTAYDCIRTQYDVGVGYGDDLRHAAKVILQTLQNTEGVVSDPAPDVVATELGGSSVVLRARWWTASERVNVVRTGNAVISDIKKALDDAGIDMPYPTNVTLLHDQTEDCDGDRTQQREGWPAGENPPNPRPIGLHRDRPNADNKS